ncbi:hypothetical protein C9374_013482 [Naegleria lovaniensis]|uniref:Galactose oxidase n=1 Tax=Naegleria lovaniensis TaxID=51637 RepID=A0AA88H2G4_NAELO|nr:uncharacterized protein C9374_013482 [Naegleria lovaniensis]KAG2391997.1 hypothetical protein C9374_013482 [Naegleria lovaniensis]
MIGVVRRESCLTFQLLLLLWLSLVCSIICGHWIGISHVVNGKYLRTRKFVNRNMEHKYRTSTPRLPTLAYGVEWKLINMQQEIPSPRFDFAYASTPDYSLSFLFGGVNSSWSIMNDFWILEHQHLKWTKIVKENNDDLWPPALRDAAAVFCLGDFYVFGGKSTGGSVSGDVWKFNLSLRKWSIVNRGKDEDQAKIASRFGHSAICIGNSFIVIFGGSDKNNNFYNQLHLFNNGTFTEIEPNGPVTIPPRMYTPIIFNPTDSSLFAFGGYVKISANESANNDELWQFDLLRKQWKQIEKQNSAIWPPSRSGHNLFKTTQFSNNFYVFGGELLNGLGTNDMYSFNVITSQWTVIPTQGNSSPPGRLGAAFIQKSYSSGEYILFGGVSGWTNTKVLGDEWLASLR